MLSGDGAGQWRRAVQHGTTNTTWLLDRPFASACGPAAPSPPLPIAPLGAPALSPASYVQIGKLEAQLLFVGNYWGGSHFQLYGMCLDCVVAENTFNSSFAASWGRNPHNIVGGWQPNFQVEWLSNTVVGGTGITLMTSDQPLVPVLRGALDGGGGSSGGTHAANLARKTMKINASYTGPLNWRVVLRGNRFHGGGGLQLGINSSTSAQTAGNILVDSNILAPGTCNVTSRPMPSGGDINLYLPCGEACFVHDLVLNKNNLVGTRSC